MAPKAQVAKQTGEKKVVLQDKPLAQPEPDFGQPRPMTGFFSGLTAAQKASALAYTGEENHGEPDFQKRTCPK
jgi:hypothetical protein